jgi:hypothetical protein
MSLDSRIKKAETAVSDIGCDKETYIKACMAFCQGDTKPLAALPPIKGGRAMLAAMFINAKSRIDNEKRISEMGGR